PFFAEQAAESMAAYWVGQARACEQSGTTEFAAVLWQKARTMRDSPERALWARSVLEPLAPLMSVFRVNGNSRFFWNAFSQDGRRVVTIGVDQSARVWDVASGQPVGKLLPHKTPIIAVCL